MMALLVTLWGARLTFNFARKGGYSGVEDYRWAVLRGRMTPRRFQIFNLLFIVLAQNALLVLIALPANAASTGALSGPHDRYQARIAWLLLLPPLVQIGARASTSARTRSTSSNGASVNLFIAATRLSSVSPTTKSSPLSMNACTGPGGFLPRRFNSSGMSLPVRS